MSDIFDDFLEEKQNESEFLKIAPGKEAKIVKVNQIKPISKLDFGGKDKKFIRLVVMVELPDGSNMLKNFDNSTPRFVQTLKDAGIVVGSSFTLHREGEKEKTRYTLLNVQNPQKQGTQSTIPTGPNPTTNAASAAGTGLQPKS